MAPPPATSPPDPLLDAADDADPDDDWDTESLVLGVGSRMFPPDEQESQLDGIPSLRPGPTGVDPGDVEAEIRALEARLDHMIRSAGAVEDDADASPPRPIAAEAPAAEVPAAGDARPPLEDLSAVVRSKFYARQWGRTGLRNRSEEVDEFGLDTVYEASFRPVLDFLYSRWFRAETSGVEHLPPSGRCLVVANHSGTLPLDGAMLRTAVRRELGARELRWLAEDFVYYLPFVGVMMSRLGAVRACQENAERLLRKESLVAVFPEGLKGSGKLFGDRYRLQRFGRGGFIRLCLRTRTPLVPCAVVGAEEANPLLYRVEHLVKVTGLPYLPVTPTFPLLGPLGLLPAPTKWRIRFGEPISVEGYGPEAADDDLLVGRLAERVRGTIQSMVDELLRRRRSIWFG
ncbi:MAG: acyltransferase family protein [Polyangiaceae bacterium]|nr:acyltransferase family protein [Polyangiaceae bacterium]